MFKIQHRPAESQGDWEDDPRRFQTAAEAEKIAVRWHGIAFVETRIVEEPSG